MLKLLLLSALLGACTVVVRPAAPCAHSPYAERVVVTEVHHKRYHADWGPVHATAWATTMQTEPALDPFFRATGCTNLNPNVCAARGQ